MHDYHKNFNRLLCFSYEFLEYNLCIARALNQIFDVNPQLQRSEAKLSRGERQVAILLGNAKASLFGGSRICKADIGLDLFIIE
jgi:hypothetical protein